MTAAATRTGATARLADFVVGPAPAPSLAAARSLFDTRCAYVAGRATEAGKVVAATADELADDSPATAAWRAAATAAATRMDDVVAYGGAGAPVWPALIALAADRGIADDSLLAVAGETGILTALALWRAGGYRQPERGFHATSVFGVLAAATACARLIGLDTAGVIRTLSIAASQSCGLLANFGTTAEAFHAGMAARDGLVSAVLAEAGYAGAPDILEARQGWGEAFLGLANSRLDRLDAEIVASPSLDDALRSKWIPGHIDHQRPVRALVAALAGSTSGVRRVIVDGVPPASDGNRFSTPATADQAAASMRYAVCCALRHRVVRLSDHSTDVVRATALDAIEIRSASRWDRGLDEPEADARHVEVGFDDGTVRRAVVDDFPPGATHDEVAEKWRRTADELTPSTVADELRALLITEGACA